MWLVIAVPIISVVTVFLYMRGYRMYRIPTGSMIPAIPIGDRVFAKPIGEPKRGDIVTYRPPLNPKATVAHRVVALPGETVLIRNKKLSINGRVVDEPYVVHDDPYVYLDRPGLPEPYRSRDQFGPYTLPPNHYFLMGDNRDKSADSRYSGGVPRESITGRLFLAMGPFFQRMRAL